MKDNNSKHRGAKVVRLGAATALAVGGLMATTSAPVASAGNFVSYVSSNSGGANLRACPSTNCRSLGYMRNGVKLDMVCWTDSQWVYPPNSNYASPRWFRVWTYALGASGGYVHSSLVANQTSVPHC